jgi:hypothetical protein
VQPTVEIIVGQTRLWLQMLIPDGGRSFGAENQAHYLPAPTFGSTRCARPEGIIDAPASKLNDVKIFLSHGETRLQLEKQNGLVLGAGAIRVIGQVAVLLVID